MNASRRCCSVFLSRDLAALCGSSRGGGGLAAKRTFCPATTSSSSSPNPVVVVPVPRRCHTAVGHTGGGAEAGSEEVEVEAGSLEPEVKAAGASPTAACTTRPGRLPLDPGRLP